MNSKRSYDKNVYHLYALLRDVIHLKTQSPIITRLRQTYQRSLKYIKFETYLIKLHH